MELYEGIIRDTMDLLEAYTPRSLEVSMDSIWETGKKNELILKSDSAFELGGSYKAAVSYQAVTSSKELVPRDEILLYGEDLGQIREDTVFARIALLHIDKLEDDDIAYKTIKDLEFVKYNTNIKGYMMRASTMDRREQVRISKSAIKEGISFENVGNNFIKNYKENPYVKGVKLIFISEDLPILKDLITNAGRVDDITFTLNHALSEMDLDCNSCDLKSICDEVEGMRELHFDTVKANT